MGVFLNYDWHCQLKKENREVNARIACKIPFVYAGFCLLLNNLTGLFCAPGSRRVYQTVKAFKYEGTRLPNIQ